MSGNTGWIGSTLAIHIREFTHALQFTRDPQVNTCVAFAVISNVLRVSDLNSLMCALPAEVKHSTSHLPVSALRL